MKQCLGFISYISLLYSVNWFSAPSAACQSCVLVMLPLVLLALHGHGRHFLHAN